MLISSVIDPMASAGVFPQWSEYVDGHHTLRLDIQLTPSDEYSCPIAETEAAVEDIQFNTVDGNCTVDLVMTDGSVVRASDTIDEKRCFCAIFDGVNCVPHYQGIEDGVIHVSTYVTDREAVRQLIRELRTAADAVSLNRLTAINDGTGEQTVLFDMSILTAKQREALQLAVGRGYYTDDGVNLEMLASELDISAAALSQRLRLAQAKLVTDLFG